MVGGGGGLYVTVAGHSIAMWGRGGSGGRHILCGSPVIILEMEADARDPVVVCAVGKSHDS